MLPDLQATVIEIANWLADDRGYILSKPVILDAYKYDIFKTYDYFLRVLNRNVLDLYRGDISEGQFVDNLADLIEQQMRRAWNEGMRENDLDPQEEMTAEWEAQLQEIIASEYAYVDGFAADIVSAAESGADVSAYQSRASLWANRYNDTVNEAKLATAEAKDKYEWVFGDTVHCSTCSQLNGIVASAAEWEQSGIKPQAPPNGALECGGWKCQCRLEPTDKKRTARAFERILDIAVSANV